MSRSPLLHRIRRACQTGKTPDLPEGLPEFPCFDDPVSRFSKELEGVGGFFFDARKRGKLSGILSRILKSSSATRIYWENEKLFQEHGIPCANSGMQTSLEQSLLFSTHLHEVVELPLFLERGKFEKQELADIVLSASTASCGIAETGTVVHQVTLGVGRLLPVLPPAHVVFLSEKNLMANHAQFFQSLQPGRQGSAMTLVTGPSRTADIEKTLVVGVHGPKKIYVVLT